VSTEYTPTTSEVQQGYTETIRLGQSSDEWVQETAHKVAAFDRWLAGEIRKAKAEALRQAADTVDDSQTSDEGLPYVLRRDPALWLNERADAIEKEAER
jgi:hypothetical protein